jgi:hypothetical protein
VIANPTLIISGEDIDASAITPALLQDVLHEAGGAEANVATGYHAIEFLLWGQDLGPYDATAGQRPWTDFALGEACTNGNCDRRAEYLRAATELLVSDLTYMTDAWAEGGAARVEVLADADGARLAGLEADLRALGLKTDISAVGTEPQAWQRACRKAELVVHATPMGMHTGEPAILTSDAFHSGQWVYDLIYMFPETALMRVAHEAGARTSNGLGMLMHQGALSFSIWTGREAPVAVMRRVLEEAVYGIKAEGR